jgi:hypothetical protein
LHDSIQKLSFLIQSVSCSILKGDGVQDSATTLPVTVTELPVIITQKIEEVNDFILLLGHARSP